MRVGVPKERAAGERRVALVPELAGRLVTSGFEVLIERGAGEAASFPDADYEEAGTRVVGDVYDDADAVAKVQSPSEDEVARLREGQVLVGFLQPLTDPDGIARLAARGITAFAMESIPRITRAQPMDALSSQATVSGYKATVIAAERLPKFFPMLMTGQGPWRPRRCSCSGPGSRGCRQWRLRGASGLWSQDSTYVRSSESRSRAWAPAGSTWASSAKRPRAATPRSSPRSSSDGSRRSSRRACPSSTL